MAHSAEREAGHEVSVCGLPPYATKASVLAGLSGHGHQVLSVRLRYGGNQQCTGYGTAVYVDLKQARRACEQVKQVRACARGGEGGTRRRWRRAGVSLRHWIS